MSAWKQRLAMANARMQQRFSKGMMGGRAVIANPRLLQTGYDAWRKDRSARKAGKEVGTFDKMWSAEVQKFEESSPLKKEWSQFKRGTEFVFRPVTNPIKRRIARVKDLSRYAKLAFKIHKFRKNWKNRGSIRAKQAYTQQQSYSTSTMLTVVKEQKDKISKSSSALAVHVREFLLDPNFKRREFQHKLRKWRPSTRIGWAMAPLAITVVMSMPLIILLYWCVLRRFIKADTKLYEAQVGTSSMGRSEQKASQLGITSDGEDVDSLLRHDSKRNEDDALLEIYTVRRCWHRRLKLKITLFSSFPNAGNINMAANFHDENFDVHSYLKTTLQSHNYEGERARLKDATTSLDRKLQKEVADNFPKLKEQVRVVQDIERKMEVIKSSGSHLSQSVNRIKHLLQEPYEQVQSKVQELHNVWGAAEVLRKLSKFLALVAKVRNAQERLSNENANLPNLELPNEAKTLRDIEIILQDKGQTLKGIEVVDCETEWIRKSMENVKHRSHELLKRGLTNTNQAEIRTAVQAFYNFDLMGKVVKKVLSDHAQELRKVVAQELDVLSIVAGSGITNEQEQAGKVKTVLFGKIDSTFQLILQHISKLSQLVKVLSNTKDPVTQESFIQLLETENSGCVFIEEVWKPVSVMIGERVPKIVKRFPLVINEYPRLHNAFCIFVQSALEHFPSSEGASDASQADPKSWLETCLSEPHLRYMKSVRDRLSEKVKIILQRLYSMQPKDSSFGTSSVAPESGKTGRSRSLTAALQAAVAAAQIDISPLIAAIGHEFSQIRSEQQQSLLAAMCELVNNVVQNWVHQMWEEKINDTSCSQVSQAATNNQLFNSVIALALIRGNQDLRHLVSTIGSKDMQPGLAKLLKTISEMEEMADGIVNEVFHSCEQHLTGPIMALSETAGVEDVKTAVASTSDRWSQITTNLLVLYSPTQSAVLEDRFRMLISNIVDVIVKRASLLNISFIQHSQQTEIAAHIGGLVQIVLDNNPQIQPTKISKSLKTLKAVATVLSLKTSDLHAALTQTGRLSPVQMELNALSSITLLHCILCRIPSSKPIFSLLSKSPAEYVAYLCDGTQEAEQTGWNLLKEWGPRATGDDEKLIWECGQAWNQKRIQIKS